MDEKLNIEQIINKNIDVKKMGLTLVGKEYQTPLGRIDILTKDVNGNYIPIEIKLGTASDSAIGQILRYMHTMQTDRGIIMANDFTKGVKAVSKDLNIELIQYTINVIVNDEPITIDNIFSTISEDVIDPLYNPTNHVIDTFISNYIKITNNKNDYVNQRDIYNNFIIYCESNKHSNIYINIPSVRSFYKIFREICEIKEPEAKWIPELKTNKKCYKGIKMSNL